MLIPVFNTRRYVADALRSISEQSYRDFEIVVVDDGSTDGSLEVLRAYAASEPRMRLITRPNRGLIATRNELVARACGDWVAWMDSDDISRPDRLSTQLQSAREDDSLVCIGTEALCVDPSGAPLVLETFPAAHEEIVEHQRRGGGMRFPTTIMRRDAVMAVGGFREPFRLGEDLDLLLRLGERGRLRNIQMPLYDYRQHVASVCATQGSRWHVYREHILELARQRRLGGPDALQAGGSITIPPVEDRHRRRAITGTYAFWARCALRQNDQRRALRYAASAVFHDPLARMAWSSLMRTAFFAERAQPAS